MTIFRESSISEDKILQDIRSYVRTRPDGSKWLDYFDGSTGATLLELLSGFGAFLAYQARSSRQESNLLTAKLKSSIYAAAYTFGYPINRKQSALLEITGTISSTNYATVRSAFMSEYNRYIVNFLPIGYINGYPISFPLSYNLESKVPITHDPIVLDDLLVGEWKYHVHTVANDTAFYEVNIPVTIPIENIDNNEVYVTHNRGGSNTVGSDIITGGVTINTRLTKFIENIDGTSGNETVLIKTLVNNITIMFGSDAIGFKVNTGDIILIRYLEIKEQLAEESPDFSLANLRLEDDRLTASNVAVQRRQTNEDDLTKIVKVIPGYFAARRRMVTPIDHESIVNSYPAVRDSKFAANECSIRTYELHNRGVCDTGGGSWITPSEVVGQCCTHVMSYILDDRSAWSEGELSSVYSYLRDYQIVGENLLFRQASSVRVHLKIHIILDIGASQTDIAPQIRRVLETQCYNLQSIFNTAKFVADALQITGVKLCYLNTPSADRQLSWSAYFIPGDVTVTYSTDENSLGDFTDEGLNDGYEFPPFIDGVSDITQVVNTALTITLPEAVSTDNVRYSMSNLPAGLSFNNVTRQIIGTVTSPISQEVTYTATESNTRYAKSVAFTITITSS